MNHRVSRTSRTTSIARPPRPPSWRESLLPPYQEPQDYESTTTIYFFLGVLVELFSIACVIVLAYFLRFTEEFEYFHWKVNEIPPNGKYNHCRDYAAALFPVSEAVFYSTVPSVPVVLIILGEVGFFFFSEKRRKVLVGPSHSMKITLLTRRICRFLAIFALGLFLTSVIVDMIKLITGRPRPYFDATPAECTSTSDREKSLSFPSFHAAEVAFAATFLGCYIHSLLKMHGTYSLRPILMTVLTAWVTVFSLHRWMVNENHWEDIVVGIALGATIAFYLALWILHSFKESKNELEEHVLPTTPTVVPQQATQAVNTVHRWHDYLNGDASAGKPIMAFGRDPPVPSY